MKILYTARATFCGASRPKMLRQLEALALIVRSLRLAVEQLRPCVERLVVTPADGLAVLEYERHLVAAHFEHSTRAGASVGGRAKTRIEEARIVHAEFTHHRVDRHHLGGEVGGDVHALARGEDVELVRV